MRRLSQLRVLFVLYMLAKTTVEIALGSTLCLESAANCRLSWLIDALGSPAAISLLTIFGNGVLLLLGLVLFHFLIRKRNWARIILLIIAWVNVIDAVLGILFQSQATRFLSHCGLGIDWDRILLMDRVTDILGLIYWGYAISVMQFNESVRKEFFAPPAESVPPQTP